ncbi:hypothetical protein KGD83_05810 [Nocardiopsis akebiae]|uniref:Uncharacterized protein n=1 Tax=Nocardiopsis akebiae TaxID=2831968 RepID=A0ABX8C6W5_9ACTN|nr:hypothetical protein KGD83_05810 [Nocardiopsis akebiae]
MGEGEVQEPRTGCGEGHDGAAADRGGERGAGQERDVHERMRGAALSAHEQRQQEGSDRRGGEGVDVDPEALPTVDRAVEGLRLLLPAEG